MTLDLAAGAHPVLTGLLFAAGALYAAGFSAAAARPALGRPVVALGALVHLAATVGRGLAIDFLPLTSKVESFSAFSLCVALVLLAAWRETRAYVLPVLGLAVAALAAALLFPLDLVVPPPLMRTAWYPLHVPLSFFAYGAWIAAGGGALAWLFDRDPAWLRRIDRLALIGFGLWSLSMICGGFWGVVAWGAYFLWDPKVVWSVILWFHFASFIHVRLTPSLRDRDWVRPAMALAGVAWILVAYVGTSFLFGDSSHAF